MPCPRDVDGSLSLLPDPKVAGETAVTPKVNVDVVVEAQVTATVVAEEGEDDEETLAEDPKVNAAAEGAAAENAFEAIGAPKVKPVVEVVVVVANEDIGATGAAVVVVDGAVVDEVAPNAERKCLQCLLACCPSIQISPAND